MAPTDVWVALGLLVVAILAALGALTRYVVGVLRDVDRVLDDKISIGEFNRRHEDLERIIRINFEERLRKVERWQDLIEGRMLNNARRRLNDQDKC